MSPDKEPPEVEPDFTHAEEVDWEIDGKALPEVLDPVMTKALVQRYIETERNRNRRALLWLSGIFLFVVLLILTTFLSIGVFVFRKSMSAADKVEERVKQMKLETGAYAAEVAGLTNDIERLRSNAQSIESSLNQNEALASRKEKLLKSDLKRFSKWVSGKNRKDQEAIKTLERKLLELEEASALRQKEFEKIKAKYEAAMQGAVAVKEPPPVTVPSAPAPPVETNAAEATPAADPVYSAMASSVKAGPVSVVSFPNGDRYKGELKKGLFNGWGTYWYANGDRYEGEFKDDMKSGEGTMVYANGDKYIGKYSNNMQNGQGTFYFKGGERFVGQFSNGRMTGKGTRFYKNGNKYEGDFVNDVRHGNGVLTYTNGDVYKGEFRDDNRTGKGTYLFTDGSRYEGDFESGKRHGKGRYVYAGGHEFIGEFRDGKREGVGLSIYPNGQQIKGLWKNDQFIQVVK
ncbi:hypothetical protein BVX97_00685 [bacterium E08(2017)]|nr:hypothetical protein BVX97_00685 [bacterium E08(2017)]